VLICNRKIFPWFNNNKESKVLFCVAQKLRNLKRERKKMENRETVVEISADEAQLKTYAKFYMVSLIYE